MVTPAAFVGVMRVVVVRVKGKPGRNEVIVGRPPAGAPLEPRVWPPAFGGT